LGLSYFERVKEEFCKYFLQFIYEKTDKQIKISIGKSSCLLALPHLMYSLYNKFCNYVCIVYEHTVTKKQEKIE